MDKTYVKGYFTEKEGKYGKFMNVSLLYSDLKPDEKGYVRFIINAKKQPDDKGTHYATYSTWKPEAKKQEDIGLDDIPF